MNREVAILGAGGYTGRELLRLLHYHPHFRASHISSDRYAGRALGEVFPALSGENKSRFKKHGDPLPEGIPVFLATPDEISLQKVPELIAQGHPLVDLSGAFRLHNRQAWERAYGRQHSAFDCMKKVTYGLPELSRDAISKAKAVANPGCYPTSVILPLVALGELRDRLVSINIHSSSGVSGAGGRVEVGGFAFQNVYENFRAYKVLCHQHEPEIDEYAASGLTKGLDCPITFTPHLLPLQRGILSTMVLHWNGPAPQGLDDRLAKWAAKEAFLRFYEKPEEVELAKVQYTNYLDLGLRSRDSITVILSALDNLVKGAAGQAIQNMNLMLQLPEHLGLLSSKPTES